MLSIMGGSLSEMEMSGALNTFPIGEKRKMAETRCWCGGQVGLRVPGDENGLGCLESVFHTWNKDFSDVSVNRLYVAGPMTGYPESNYPEFYRAEDFLVGLGFEVVNPANFGPEDGGSYEDLLRMDLQMLLTCNGVALLEGWWGSVGARNEVQVAGILKMPCRPVKEWQEHKPTQR